MLDALITSKTRIKILLKFFLNKNNKSYLRGLEQEFDESSNAIRVELNRFEKAGLLRSSVEGNKKYFQANTEHPLFNDINSILLKMVGIDTIIENITSKLGEIDAAYLVGDFAKGTDSKIIDLVLVGREMNIAAINKYIEKAEKIIKRKIRYISIKREEMADYFEKTPTLLIWSSESGTKAV